MSSASAISEWRAAPSDDEVLRLVSNSRFPFGDRDMYWNFLCCASVALLITLRIWSFVIVGGIGPVVSTITSLFSFECLREKAVGCFFFF